MHDVLAFWKDVDLGGHALNILDMIRTADLCFVALIVTVLLCLGYKMCSGHKGVFHWGLRLALLTSLLYGGITYAFTDEIDARGLAVLAARSALCGGALLALFWIFFPILVFVYGHLRLALTGFLLYGGYAIIVAGSTFRMEQLPGIALRSLVAAGLVVIVAWIFQPLVDLFHKRFPKPQAAEPPPPQKPVADADELARLERKYRKAIKKMKRQQAQGAGDNGSDDDEVHTVQIEMRRRRDKARLTVELTYAMTMSDVTTPWPRDMFESWISRYLGDHLPPEDVEENSKQLQSILTQQKKITQQLSSGNSPGTQLEDLNHWLLEEQRRIQNDPHLSQEERQRKLLDLHQMYTSLVNRILGEQNHGVVQLPYRPAGPSSGGINAM